MVTPPTLAEFGHGSMKVNGKPAVGERQLLVLMVDWKGMAKISTLHAIGYYRKLAFSDPAPPFSTDKPASLAAYFRENSSGRFTFKQADISSIDMGTATPAGNPEPRAKQILQKVDKNLLKVKDADRDGRLENDELAVVIIENFWNAFPATRRADEITLTFNVPPHPPETLKVSLNVAGNGPRTPFYQIAHETSHLLGTDDMYFMGNVPGNANNQMLTLMGSYSFTSDDQGIVHLDMWHKMQLGWAEPRRFDMFTPRAELVRDDRHDGAILLWNQTKRTGEYFIIERRRSNGGRRYDANFPGDGVLIWRVRKAGGATTVTNLAPPNLAAGAQGVWRVGMQTPRLRWADGSATEVTIKVSAGPDGAATVAWGDELFHNSSVRHFRLLHGGNGSDGVGGLTRQGTFYGVTTAGNFTWNNYKGRGEQVGDPLAIQSWHPNTGNPIGRGFGHLKHVVGAGDGAILFVHPDGTLRWLDYDGSGVADVTGGTGWLPSSGNTIRSDFGDVVRMFVWPSTGSGTRTIFTVRPDGLLRFYRYTGNGEHDPGATRGWHPNSGNPVGRGWLGVRHVHAQGNVFFVVTTDGFLRWYSYSGTGVADPPGVIGWDTRSSNEIGNGWGNFVHIFGGVTDLGGFGFNLFAVNPAGELRWYRYTGRGERDPTGSLNWHPRSGTIIGTGW